MARTPPSVRAKEKDRRELKYYGTAACRAIFSRRPGDIVRVYVERERVEEFGPLLKWAAGQRKAYHLVGGEELEKITESVHHQGIALIARERPVLDFAALRDRLDAERELLLYLDGVENPHNLGAILRTCAHFGVRFVLGAQGRLPRLSPSACRVAEGGAEAVDLVALDRPLKQLKELRRLGFLLAATAVDRGDSLYQVRFPARTLLALGAEVEGISKPIAEAADLLLTIPGSGAVESLNVGIACAVMVSEYRRQLES